MTSDESRLNNLESKYHDVDKRQESFETFVRAYIRNSNEQMQELKADLKDFKTETRAQFARMDAKMDNLSAQMHNMAVGFSAGVGAILVAMFIAIFFNK